MDLLSVLPDVPLELVFARLSPDDLMRLRVNRALREAVEGARVWTHHARVLYDCGDKDDGSDAWQQWCAAAREFGRYGALYGRLRRAWRTIYAAHNEVVVPGASEAQIAALEAETGFSLPLELRCQLRITQGESHNRCLLGSFEVYQVLQRRFLLPLDAVRLVLRRGVLAVAAENGSAGSALLGLDDNGALAMCGHVLAPSWTQYVEDMAAQLQSGRLVYTGAGMGVSLFPVTGIARAVTRGILVEASPLFLALPSFSQDQVPTPLFFRLPSSHPEPSTCSRIKFASAPWPTMHLAAGSSRGDG